MGSYMESQVPTVALLFPQHSPGYGKCSEPGASVGCPVSTLSIGLTVFCGILVFYAVGGSDLPQLLNVPG